MRPWNSFKTSFPSERLLRAALFSRRQFTSPLYQIHERNEVEEGMVHDQRPQPAETHEQVRLHEPIGDVKGQHGKALVEVVQRTDHDTHVDRRSHAIAAGDARY